MSAPVGRLRHARGCGINCQCGYESPPCRVCSCGAEAAERLRVIVAALSASLSDETGAVRIGGSPNAPGASGGEK